MGKLSVQEDFACGYDLSHFNEHPRVLCYGCFGFENIGLYKIVAPRTSQCREGTANKQNISDLNKEIFLSDVFVLGI